VCRYGIILYQATTYRSLERLRFLESKPLGQNIQEPAERRRVSFRE